MSGNAFYGTTSIGSTNDDGTVFTYSLNTGFTSLHTFLGSDGANPVSDLVQSGSTLYGTTSEGGTYGAGTILAINTNGTAFTNFFNFAYTNGGNPCAGLVLAGSTLYGTTLKGGAYGAGTIFAINTNGTGFTNIYNFNYTNGANPQAGLALVSNVLCGTTVHGGAYSGGTVFLIGTNGSGFNILHSFGGSYGDGMWPYSRVAVSSNGAGSYSLYGTTEIGGNDEYGTVFAANISGPGFSSSSYSTIYEFQSYSLSVPMAGLALSGNTLYGTTTDEGTGGNIFSMTTGGGSVQSLHTFQTGSLISTNRDGGDSRAGLVLSGRTLYGTAAAGGTNGCGTIFAINTDGTGFANYCSLDSANAGPWAGLILSGNTLYGTATSYISVGSEYYGPDSPEIFSINTDGSDFTNLSNFAGTQDRDPMGNLILGGNTLYGTAEYGGSSFEDLGAIFAVNTDGTDFTNLYSISDSTLAFGYEPAGGLVLNGNTLYGTTEYGGSNSYGTVFAINTDGTGFTNIFNFGGTNGHNPVGTLVLSGNTLYGVTEYDGNRNYGTIFAVNTDGSGFTNLYNFSGYDGANPQGNLLLCGDTLYGTTTSGGSGGYGTVFSINTDGSCFTTLYDFSGGNDGAVPYDGLVLSGNTLYGTTSSGGGNGNGTVFALSLGAIPLNVQPDGGNVVLTWGNPAFNLQAAQNVNGPYVTIPGAASPYTNAINSAQQYFRLQSL